MIPLWQACLLTAIFMAGQDVFGTSLVIAEARNLAWWPGILDAAGDWVNRAGQALTAGAYVKYGLWALDTQLLLGVTMLTSLTVTNTATPLASRLLPQRRGIGHPLGRHGLGHLMDRLDSIEAQLGGNEQEAPPDATGV